MAWKTWKQTTEHLISARHLHATIKGQAQELKPMRTGNVTIGFLFYSYNCSNCVYASGTLIQQASSEGKNNGVTFSYRYATSSSDGKSQLFTACSCKKKRERERWYFVFFCPNRISLASNLLIPGCGENSFLFGNLLGKREDEAGISPEIPTIKQRLLLTIKFILSFRTFYGDH